MSPEARKEFMITYLKLKVEEQDWHGVADAAMDLREIEVELSLRSQNVTSYVHKQEPY